jgi:hypothetical protein
VSAFHLEEAREAAARARARLDTTLAETQTRFQPRNLAGEAWGKVKHKGAELTGEAVGAVKRRPGAVSVAVGALALFLARRPLGRAIGRLASRKNAKSTD